MFVGKVKLLIIEKIVVKINVFKLVLRIWFIGWLLILEVIVGKSF